MAIILAASLSVVLAMCGGKVLSWLTDNENIVSFGIIIMWVQVALEIGRAINIWATQALRATGDVNFQLYVGITVQWLV